MQAYVVFVIRRIEINSIPARRKVYLCSECLACRCGHVWAFFIGNAWIVCAHNCSSLIRKVRSIVSPSSQTVSYMHVLEGTDYLPPGRISSNHPKARWESLGTSVVVDIVTCVWCRCVVTGTVEVVDILSNISVNLVMKS